MSIQLTFLRYYQVAQAKKQTHFLAQDRIWKTMFLKFEHYVLAIIAISEVCHYGFLKEHSSIS